MYGNQQQEQGNYNYNLSPENGSYYVNHGFGFDGGQRDFDEKPPNPNAIIPNAPTVMQPATNGGPRQVRMCKSYFLSIPGIIRILLIVFQMAGWIALAAVPKVYNAQIFLPPEFASTRDAYLFFSILGFLLSIIIFLLFFLNIVSLGYLNKLPWALIVLVTDVLWVVPTFVLAVVCAVREGSLREPIFQYLYFINIGAYGAGAFFAFLCALLYGVNGCYHLLAIVRGGINVPSSFAD